VLAQLDNLLTHPTVASAIEAKQLRVHGWVYDMSGGVVETYDAQVGRFVPIGSASFVSATPGEVTRGDFAIAMAPVVGNQ
jgi:carbonic anhydrase